MGKHAYLIMAHNEFEILGKLLELLDFEENDIYLHIDKNVKEFPETMMRERVKLSKLVLFPRRGVNWGGYSQIACEMSMFQYMMDRVTERYQYYHLISGVDLPLKPQKVIHEFFDVHDGQEFVTMGDYDPDEKNYIFRVKYFFPFQELRGAARRKGKDSVLYRIMADGILHIQKRLHVNRCKGKEMCMGANWINITYDCMKYLVSQKDEIYRQYKMTLCADEFFVQNTLLASPFREKINKEPLRYIDWKRGDPYVFRDNDYEVLMDSGYLWARKFDTRVDRRIIERIYSALKE